jgi:hypothetical protein
MTDRMFTDLRLDGVPLYLDRGPSEQELLRQRGLWHRLLSPRRKRLPIPFSPSRKRSRRPLYLLPKP